MLLSPPTANSLLPGSPVIPETSLYLIDACWELPPFQIYHFYFLPYLLHNHKQTGTERKFSKHTKHAPDQEARRQIHNSVYISCSAPPLADSSTCTQEATSYLASLVLDCVVNEVEWIENQASPRSMCESVGLSSGKQSTNCVTFIKGTK